MVVVLLPVLQVCQLRVSRHSSWISLSHISGSIDQVVQ